MISVIVPVYNRIELLKKTLDSIFAQTYKDIEVIVIDDESAENVKNVVDGYVEWKVSEYGWKTQQLLACVKKNLKPKWR